MSRPIGSTHGGGRVLKRVNYFLSLVDGQTYNNGNNNNITHQLRLLRYLQRSFSLSLFLFFIVIMIFFLFTCFNIELAAAATVMPILSNDIILHRDRFS